MTQPRILVVDHSPPISEYVKTMLEGEGYAVRVCNSSTEALVAGSRYKPALLIIDPIMPGLSGVEVATRMCRQETCKALFLSTLADDSDFKEVLKGLREQGFDVRALPKPFEKQDFLDFVRRAVGAPPVTQETPISNSESEQAKQPESTGSSDAHFSTGANPKGEFDALLKMAGLNLYRSNAFRITGLGITSSLREVSREAEKLEMMIKLGSIQPASGLFPLKDPPAAPEIRAAVQILKDPEQRLLHEFFWFWPCTETEADDPALQALRAGKHSLAIEIWTQTKGKANGTAIHNLAVLYHLEALGTYLRRSTTMSVTKSEDVYLWSSAFRYWKALIDRSEFWYVLTERIRVTNDPRLRFDVAQQIWKTLPNALLRINAEVAIATAEKGEFEEAGAHRRLIFTSPFGESVAKAELLRSLAPVREELNHLCDSAERETRSNLRTAGKIVRKLLDDKSRLLQAFNYLLGVADEACADAHDRVALTARSCVVDYVNETKDWETSRQLLEECLALAEGQELRAKLEDDLEIVGRNLVVANQPTQGSRSAQPNQHSTTANPRPAAQRGSTSAIPSKRKGNYMLIAVIAIIVLVLYGSLKDHNETEHPASSGASGYQSTSPQPVGGTYQYQSPSSSGAASTNSYSQPTERNPFTGNSSQREQLRSEIQTNRATLEAMENELRDVKTNMESLDSQLTSDRTTLDRMDRDNKAGLDVDQSSYEAIRQRFNSNVKVYNGWVSQYNDTRDRHKQLLAETNEKIDQFNSMGASR